MTAVAFHPDGRHLFVGSDDGTVSEWKIGSSAPERSFSADNRWVTALAISPDARWLVSACGKGFASAAGGFTTTGEGPTVRIWELATGQEKYHFEASAISHVGFAFSPNSQFLAMTTDGYSNGVIAWSLETMKVVLMSNRHEDSSELGLWFHTEPSSPTTSLLALGRIWDFTNDKPVLRKEFPITPSAVTPDWTDAYFAQGAVFDTKTFYPLPILKRDPGILEASTDGTQPRAFLKFPGGVADVMYNDNSRVLGEIHSYIPGAKTSSKGTLVWSDLLIDLDTLGQVSATPIHLSGGRDGYKCQDYGRCDGDKTTR
jgi:WD40 repeat protein